MTKTDRERQRKAPILRFKGFTDDWEQRQLNELGNIKRGASPRPISDPKWFDKNGKYGWLRISDVTSQNGQVFQIDQHLSSIGEKKTVLISDPHLIISIAATVGKPCINYIPTAIHDGFVAFLDYKFNLDFMFEWFNKNQNIWLKYGQPGAQINLNSSIIGNQKIKIPKKNEQGKIAKLLNMLNNLLVLYERKLKLLSRVKKYFLDNLFAEKEYPNLRFKGFTDAWEQRELGNIVVFIRNGITIKQDGNFGKPITRIDSISEGKLNLNKVGYANITSNVYEDYYLKNNDILFSNINSLNHIGKTSFVHDLSQDVIHGMNLLNIRVDKNHFNSRFVYYQLAIMKSKNLFKKIAKPAVNQASIAVSELKKLSIKTTSIKEQYKIQKLLATLENILTLYENKQQHLTEIKKTLLNTMFI